MLKRILNYFSHRKREQKRLEDFKKKNPKQYEKYIEDPEKYEKEQQKEIGRWGQESLKRQLEDLKKSNPERRDVTKEDFYKRILYEEYSTFGYYYISGHTPKEENNIWVHNIDEENNWDTRIKFSESDINKIMTTDEFKELVESQDYKKKTPVHVIGDILDENNIPFKFDQVILD